MDSWSGSGFLAELRHRLYTFENLSAKFPLGLALMSLKPRCLCYRFRLEIYVVSGVITIVQQRLICLNWILKLSEKSASVGSIFLIVERCDKDRDKSLFAHEIADIPRVSCCLCILVERNLNNVVLVFFLISSRPTGARLVASAGMKYCRLYEFREIAATNWREFVISWGRTLGKVN